MSDTNGTPVANTFAKDMTTPHGKGPVRRLGEGAEGVGPAAANPTAPRNVDAEEMVLSKMMHFDFGAEAIDAAAQRLDRSDFSSGPRSRIFVAMVDLRGRGVPVDLVTLGQELADRDEMNICGGPLELRRIAERAPSGAGVEHYCEIVARLATARRDAAPVESQDAAPDPCTDTANAKRLARLSGGDIRYVVKWKKFLKFDRRWKLDDDDVSTLALTKEVAVEIRREAAVAGDKDEREELWSWAKKSESRERRKAMLDLVVAEPGVAIDHEQLDSDPMLLGVRNGVVDLKTGELRRYSREDYITRVAPVNYEDATARIWTAFLDRVLPDPEVRAFVHRAVGYSITGSVGEEVLFFAHGSGANGKSKFLGGLHDLLGRNLAYTAPSELIAMQRHRGHPTELAALHGMRLVTCSELDAGLRLDEARVKSLSGGDEITGRGMKQDFWSFPPRFKLWLVGNHRPRIIGTDEGIWRRLLLVPFTQTIPVEERDHRLAEKLRAELPGILRWAIDGCLLWQREGLKPPDQVLAASAVYREEQDSLADFLASRCERIANARVGAKQLFESYKLWCIEAGEEPVNGTVFGRMLGERGIEKKATSAGRIYLGLKLVENVYDPSVKVAP